MFSFATIQVWYRRDVSFARVVWSNRPSTWSRKNVHQSFTRKFFLFFCKLTTWAIWVTIPSKDFSSASNRVPERNPCGKVSPMHFHRQDPIFHCRSTRKRTRAIYRLRESDKYPESTQKNQEQCPNHLKQSYDEKCIFKNFYLWLKWTIGLTESLNK